MEFESGNADPYAVLGVPFAASIEICEASYKALIKAFHPDAFKGDKEFAQKRSIELNSAIQFLKDPKKKHNYDNKFADTKNKKNEEYAEKEEDSEFSNASETFRSDWEYACKYYPELISLHRELNKLSSHYAGLFIAIIVDQKLYHEAEDLCQYLENQFLTSKFSDDTQLKQLAKLSILKKNKRFARELNVALKILGIGSKEKILKQLSKEFPNFSRGAYTELNLMTHFFGVEHETNKSAYASDFENHVHEEDFSELKKQFEKKYAGKGRGFKFPFRK